MIRFAVMVHGLILVGFLAAQGLADRRVLNEQPLNGVKATVLVVSQLTNDPGGRIPLQFHGRDEEVLNICGARVLMPDCKTLDLAPLTTIFFPAALVHGQATHRDEGGIVDLASHILAADQPFQHRRSDR